MIGIDSTASKMLPVLAGIIGNFIYQFSFVFQTVVFISHINCCHIYILFP